MGDLLRRLLFLPRPASTVAEEIDNLHFFVILVTIAGAALVTVVGGYFVIRYRRRPGVPSSHGPAHGPLALEALSIVGMAGLFLLWWSIGVRQYVRLRVAPEGAQEIYVTAKQWMWKFTYPQGNRSIARLYVPARTPVKLVMTSRDVIHSFYVPEFRVKQDVVPGRYTTLWFEVREPGSYEILCTQYCGAGHSVMRGEVVALEPADFERWLRGDPEPDRIAGPRYVPPAVVGESDPPAMLDLQHEGARVAGEQGCFRCHTIDGTPFIGPTWAGMYGARVPLADGREVLADEAYLTESMMDPAAKVHRGFLPVMPSYLGRLRPGETAAIVELMRSIRDVRPQPGARTPESAEGADAGAP